VLKRVDWTLIAVFILMFIDLRLIARKRVAAPPVVLREFVQC
jgi:hypothetical protein